MGEDQQCIFLIQDTFLTQHVIKRTKGENVYMNIVLSQNELVDNVPFKHCVTVMIIKFILATYETTLEI